ncbi:glycoside hydrolase family 30 protein [Plebeiibacterium sediminum]|uniref:Glycosyl hydrolase n=1 Tax=Plebeiibacterium sediminum TaxID=2992112 RepID=A0AAE3SF54_9BACT|nr:glycoside hydrolase family 30 protein [Plebeiobacterium sediminum]MCW3786677.1 glycosyl hydrolase [Plebeiobacterium sediminum]
MDIRILAFLGVIFFACKPLSVDTKSKEELVFNTKNKMIDVYCTSKDDNKRLTLVGSHGFTDAEQPLESEISVFVNPQKQFQTFLGIGGAITDASAEVFSKLPEKKQKELLDAYYGAQGINYTLMRTTIHSSDFSSESYTYIEEGDKELNSFSIEHDQTYRLPMIKRALSQADSAIKVYASPWSPPAFMKGRKDMLRGGKLQPEYYQSWASYYAKFIKTYEAEGIPVWGLTVQNEPMAVQTWESCIYTAEEERDFIKNYLGPTLQAEGLQSKKLIVWDHNRDLISHRANTILGDPEAAKYVWGVGFHWYETWAGGDPLWDNLRNVKESFPDKQLLFTEGCNEKFDANEYQRWSNAERYGKSMINDFNCGTVGWTDWNILLDQNGGPNHVGNFCFAPIHGDTNTGELIYTPAYYYIGHFSKFIRPGAHRVSTTTSFSDIISTSFLNIDGKMVTVVMNESEKEMDYKLIIEGVHAKLTIAPHSIQTLVY